MSIQVDGSEVYDVCDFCGLEILEDERYAEMGPAHMHVDPSCEDILVMDGLSERYGHGPS